MLWFMGSQRVGHDWVTELNTVIPMLLIRKLKMNKVAAAAKSRQSCPTLCNPIDGSPPGSSVPGILQARTLEWVAISFSKAWKWKVKSESEVAQSCPTQWPHGLQPTRLLHPWDFPGKSTGVGCHCLLWFHPQLYKKFNINESLFSILMSFLSLISVMKIFLWWHEWISNDQTFL